MNIGFMCAMANNGIRTLDEIIEEIQSAEALGLHQAWMPQIFSTDAITALSIAGRSTTSIRLGTAVTPTYPRHPTTMALQVLTASAATNGRFDLGIGLSHKLVIEDMYGIPYSRPARHMQEYLEVLMPLLNGEPCSQAGDIFSVNATFDIPDAKPTNVVIAALGPRMLEVAGTLADGTSTWMTGPKTLETHTIPLISKAATKAGRTAPRIVASFPIVLCSDAEAVREKVARKIAVYRDIPSYKNMLELEGVDDPVELAMIGDEQSLRKDLQRLADLGVNDFNAFCYPLGDDSAGRTLEFLANERFN